MKIAVVGAGNVGTALAILLAQENEVVLLDTAPEKVEKINQFVSPAQDPYIQEYLDEAKEENIELNLRATTKYEDAITGADYVIIATPTRQKGGFDVSNINDTIKKVMAIDDPMITVVIKSAVPVGYTEAMCEKYNTEAIFFSPEFSREGNELYDNLYPPRIIVGSYSNEAQKFMKMLQKIAIRKNVPTLFLNNSEAEAVEIFTNAYLALRAAYLDELDAYAKKKGLNRQNIVEIMKLDPRISLDYVDLSFGCGDNYLVEEVKRTLASRTELAPKKPKRKPTNRVTVASGETNEEKRSRRQAKK